MEPTLQPHRCPKCNALVVDRRSPVCTTCRQALPAEWIMSPKQTAKVMAIDKAAKVEHAATMKQLNQIGGSLESPHMGINRL
jgi:hypothetical protein